MTTNIVSVEGMIRYSIICTLTTISFINVFNINLQYTMLIILIVLVILSGIFILRDILATQTILSESNTLSKLTNTNVTFRNLFIGAIIIGLLSKLVSLILMILVFNHGRDQLVDAKYSKISLTTDNSITFKHYIILFIVSTIAIGLLVSLLFILYLPYESRVSLINIISILLSLSIFGITSFEMFYCVELFKVFQSNGILYQLTV